jgi:hypothetical protein
MKKIILSLMLLFGSVRAEALTIEDGVNQSIVDDVSHGEDKFKLPIWTRIGFVKGNDEFDSRHENFRRSTFLAHHEIKDAKTHYVVVWNHGMGGFKDFGNNIYPFLKYLYDSGKSFTWISPELPWSKYVNGIDGRTAWKKSGSFKKFYDSSIALVPQLTSSKQIVIVVAGHSRGGKSIANAAKNGDLCKVNPHWVIWSDASYSQWLDEAWKFCLESNASHVEVFYLKGTETQSSAKRLEKQNNKLVSIHQLTSPWYHGKIGKSVIMMSEAFR